MNDGRFGVWLPATAYSGPIDPASMIIPPHDKPPIARDTRPIGMTGDPRILSKIFLATRDHGTETPSFQTPPSNFTSGVPPGTPPTSIEILPEAALSSPKPTGGVDDTRH